MREVIARTWNGSGDEIDKMFRTVTKIINNIYSQGKQNL